MKNWTQYSDGDLLKLRIKDLDLEIEKSDIYSRVTAAFEELELKGLQFKPRIYFGDEWFSPEGFAAVAIPFYLAHPRLRALEKKFMLDCEGETAHEFCKLLRHELGHSFDHSFKVSKRKPWARIFGSPKKEYRPENNRPRPFSRNFVQNIARWYAQAHPDEDFAETFAVWLDPDSNWQTKYKKWGAFKKLSYVESLAQEFKGKKIKPPKGRMISDAKYLQSTLAHYYEKKRRDFAEEYPDFYDRDLLKIFSKNEAGKESAVSFLKRNRKAIIESISHWTGERKTVVSQLIQRLTKRCSDLKLVRSQNEERVLQEISAFLATLVSNYLFTGHFRRTL